MSQPTINYPNAGNNPLQWLIRLVKGLLVGIGGILPGLSGGVLAVIFGLYDPMIRFLSNLTHKFKENFLYFLPVGIGGLLGIFLFSAVVEKAFGRFEAQFVALFIGFVVGTLPHLWQEAGLEGRSSSDVAVTVLATLFIFGLMVFGGQNMPTIEPSPLVWFLSGALVALGFVVPGLSPSNFLIYFGLYDKMAASIAALDFGMLIPFVIGALICIFSLSKLVAHLFQAHYSKMYHFIVGTVIGSSAAIFPTVIFPAYSAEGLAAAGLSMGQAVIFGLAMFVIGVLVSYQFGKLEDSVDR